MLVPKKGIGIEIGVGSGRFASALNIHHGVEPAFAMRALAASRGIDVVDGKAESIPFPDNYFDFVFFVTTLCFVEDPSAALCEAHRVLKSNGQIIIGMIDRNSKLGQNYESGKMRNPFYQYAHFYSVNEVLELLKQAGFKETNIVQTIFSPLDDIQKIEPAKNGFGEGGFVGISAEPISIQASKQ
ncbi:class I SAM-dependent methyltransferase [Fluoribacter gormanii]|uniref:class I SAM-dependent methyltransferase n=1 Tax=Fluoribacter gormanii TaxID=464 RepID=UPI0022446D27|nr:class I SAM-dependent methyltransferase [Fluoribacter gormanii]MCW8443146.1 class I SAM-dependent methyltransferase [Fluoribacter gormanii]